MPEELRHDEDHNGLKDAGIDEGRPIAARLDDRRDEGDEKRGAPAESGRDQAGGESALRREPLQRRADAAAVNQGRADSGHDVQRVEHRKRRRHAESRPTDAAQHARDRREEARPQTVDQEPLRRLHPRLEEDEERERPLDVGQLPPRRRPHRLDEQRPRVLEVGDHDHRDERRPQLNPSIVDGHGVMISTPGRKLTSAGVPNTVCNPAEKRRWEDTMLETAAAPADATTTDAQRTLTDGFHLVIEALKLNGVKTIYGVPGIPITDFGRLAQAAGIRVVSFRHEQHAGNAAAIAGYLTKNPGV